MLEMGVYAAETFQASRTRSIFLEIGDHDRLVVADDYMGYPALAVDQEPDLTADFIRELANGLGEFRRDDKSRCGSATVEVLQAADLVCLQSAHLSVNLDEPIPTQAFRNAECTGFFLWVFLSFPIQRSMLDVRRSMFVFFSVLPGQEQLRDSFAIIAAAISQITSACINHSHWCLAQGAAKLFSLHPLRLCGKH